MNRRLFAASLCATLLGACQLNEKTEGPVAACLDVGSVCSANRECCSYGCAQGQCVPNTESGGLCRTSDDCFDAICLNGHCDPSATAREEGDRCYADYQCATQTCVETASGGHGECVPNHAPVAALTSNANPDGKLPTRTSILFDARGSSDADGDTLSYGWAVVGPNLAPVACSNGSTFSTCTISAPAVGAYRAVVTVSDGKAAAEQATANLEVVNLPPVVQSLAIASTPAKHPESPSRNVPFTVTASVRDPDGDALTCTWTATAPGGTPQPIAGATSCTTVSFTAGVEGAWTFTIHPDDGVANADVFQSVTTTVVNDAPVVNAGPDRAGNLGETQPTTPEIAVGATAVDDNGDAITYTWSLDAPLPAGSALTALTVSDGQTARFTPDVVGTYHLRVIARDPSGDFTEDTVDVVVDRFVRDLGRDVVDAEHAYGVGKVVVVGAHPDPAQAGKGALWTIDLATEASSAPITLDAPAKAVGVTPDGTIAVAANDYQAWIVNLSTGAVTGPIAHTVAVNDVVVTGSAGKDRAFLFPRTATATLEVGVIDLTNATFSRYTNFYGLAGALDPIGNRLYTVDPTYVSKYALANSGSVNVAARTQATTRSTSCMRIWSSRVSETYAFTGCGEIVSVPATSSIAVSGSLAASIRHLDTAADGSGLFADGAGTVRRFNTGLTVLPASDALPVWSDQGIGFAASAQYVFVTTGTTPPSWAIVRASGASGSPTRWGLVKLQPQ